MAPGWSSAGADRVKRLAGRLAGFASLLADRFEAAACWAGWTRLTEAGKRAAEASFVPAKSARSGIRQIAEWLARRWPALERWELKLRRGVLQNAELVRQALDRLSWAKAILVTAALLTVIAYLDELLGRPVPLRLAYLLPIWVATRIGGSFSGFVSMLIVGLFTGSRDAAFDAQFGGAAIVSFAVRWITLGGFLLTIAQIEEALALAGKRMSQDPLTGLANRTGIEALAEEALAGPSTKLQGVYIAVIDCDNFKTLNDVHGHAFGDHALKVLGRKLETAVGERGRVARIGGDEFVVLFMGVSKDEASKALEEADRTFRRMLESLDCRSGISFGLASAMEDGTTYAALCRAADMRMYERKRAMRKSRAVVALEVEPAVKAS